MAIYKNGKKSGKQGDVIHSSWNGRPYTRRMPESVANPQTEAQQAHRLAFAAISRLSSAMKAGHAVGLHWKALRDKLNTHSVFKKLNKDCFGPDGIDYSRIRISYGSATGVSITSAEIDAQGIVRVSFSNLYTAQDARDQFYLFVFCPDLHDGAFAPPVARYVGQVSAELPAEWRGHTIHLYAFMKSTKSRTSATIYVGAFCA